jgi:hypothetical protein
MVESAKTVILEVNPRLPRTFGDTTVHVSEVDFFVENDRSPPCPFTACRPSKAR